MHTLGSTGRIQTRAIMARSVIALTFSLALVPGIARAESVPAPAPSPTATTQSQGGTSTSSGASGAVPVPHPRAPLSHLPIIDLTPDFTQPDYIPNSQSNALVKETAPTPHTIPNTNNVTGATYGYEALNVGAVIKVPVFRWMTLQFDRQIGGTLDQTAVGNGANTITNTAGGPVVHPSGTNARYIGSGNSADTTLLYHATFNVAKGITLDAGDAFRHRMYADDGNGVSGTPLYLTGPAFDSPYGTYASTEAHYAFLAATYVTPPIRQLHGLTLAFTEQGAAQNVDHHVGDNLICTAANMPVINSYAYPTNNAPQLVCPGVGQEAYINENPSRSRYYTSTETVTANLPLDRSRNGTNFIINETVGALNWYENYPVPFRWASQTSYTLNKKFNNVFSIAFRYREQIEDVMGSYDIPTGSTTLPGAVSVIGTPYGYPSAQRVGSVDVIGTFHIDTKTLFH